MRVLNVGGGTFRDLPRIYKGWQQDLLDIDPEVKPDIVCDARKMGKLPAGKYDAVYCSHNLEHFYKHDVPGVLAGFHHVLKKDGFCQIAVPDMTCVFECMIKGNCDIDDVWYTSGAGPITFHEVIYGFNLELRRGNEYFAHKCGFTAKSLTKALRAAGFVKPVTASDGKANLHAFAFKSKPSPQKLAQLGV